VLRFLLATLPANQDLILIPHSNAGLYAPALSTERRVAGYVFVDAGLPTASGRVPLAPAPFFDLLKQKADSSGLLPPWTNWWDEEDIAALFPDAETRERVEREQRQLPLAYFSESLPVPTGWDERPGAFLAFGDTYAADRREATRRAWPSKTLVGGHLHMLVEPDQVARDLIALLAAIGVHPDGR
jgi:hypothetical protein